MGNRQVFALVAIVVGLLLGAVGYQKSQPTTAESIAGGIAGIAAAVAPAGNHEFQKKADDIRQAGLKRGLPYYALGGIAAVAGLVVLLAGGKPSRRG